MYNPARRLHRQLRTLYCNHNSCLSFLSPQVCPQWITMAVAGPAQSANTYNEPTVYTKPEYLVRATLSYTRSFDRRSSYYTIGMLVFASCNGRACSCSSHCVLHVPPGLWHAAACRWPDVRHVKDATILKCKSLNSPPPLAACLVRCRCAASCATTSTRRPSASSTSRPSTTPSARSVSRSSTTCSARGKRRAEVLTIIRLRWRCTC